MKEYLTKFGLLINIDNESINISDLDILSFSKSMKWDYDTQRMKTDNRSGGLKDGFLKNLFIKESFQKNYLKFFYNEENLNNLNKILQDIIKLINNPMNINTQGFFENPNNFYFLNSGDCWKAIFDKDTCTIKNLTDEEKINILKNHQEILKDKLPINSKNFSIYIFLNHFLNIDYSSPDYKKTIDSFNLNNYKDLLDKTEKSFKDAIKEKTTPDEKEAIKEDLKKIEEIEKEFNKKNELDKNKIENIFYFKWKLNYFIKQTNIKHKTDVVFPDTNSCDLNFYLFLEAFNNNEDFKLAEVDTNNFLKQLIYLYLTISKFGDNYKSNNPFQNQSVERLVNLILEEQRRREQRRREQRRREAQNLFIY
jgi:hypothetical protein